MWKPLTNFGLVSCFAVAGSCAWAHNIDLSIDDDVQCSAELRHSVSVGPGFIEARAAADDPDTLFHYAAPDQLLVDGRKVALNSAQQRLLRQYQQQLHQAGRELTLVSLEAVELALDGVSVALAALGADHPDTLDMKQAADALRQRVEDHLNQNGEVYTLDHSETDTFIAQMVDEELEPQVERLARKSASAIAWHTLKAVFTGGGSIDAKAEQMAEEIGHKVERRAERLEQRVEALCSQIAVIDSTEQKLQSAIPALAPYDLVKLDV
ncbi:DUF2884 family protein [Microbulbifer sp. 2201CG32-9]|uniref:DUF2884 family protein n=1 Tax=Microbulbifer sp. 2201CG32-9 TaxID=3232309 RepID=UPI00345BAB75